MDVGRLAGGVGPFLGTSVELSLFLHQAPASSLTAAQAVHGVVWMV